VWLLSAARVATLRDSLKRTRADFVNGPKLSTADGVEASMFVGENLYFNGRMNETGLRMGLFPRVHGDVTDLISVISFSELVTNQNAGATAGEAISTLSVRTNLDIATRVQIPKGSGVFLLNQYAPDGDVKRFGVLIEPP